MQFLWKYVDEMIGKGLDLIVLAEFFFYSALTLVPMALPLAILLASLMTFGNMSERLELLAMKAAGISLFRIIRPLIITIVFISAGAFFFANNVIPIAQVKLWTLIYSIRDKNPEVEIPENVFYDGISGYSIYVKDKDTKNNLLKDIMIYDLSKGFENITVTAADSARLQFTNDKKFLIFTLYNGESFENLQQGTPNNTNNVPYRREAFIEKQTLIEFDGNFNKQSESLMQDRYVSKNVVQLGHDIDSFAVVQDSLSKVLQNQVTKEYAELTKIEDIETANDSLIQNTDSLNIDSLFASLSNTDKSISIRRAYNKVNSLRSEVNFRKIEIEDRAYLQRRHAIEWHRKFTLSFACFIFFFIGAPLGAIIGKGGLGVPVVVSVLLFIFYYVIDNTGYKFARDGFWEVYKGMWLSASVLLPLGIFLTYKAATDSNILNSDAWHKYFKLLKFKKKKSVEENEPYNYTNELYKSFLKNSKIAFVLYITLFIVNIFIQNIEINIENTALSGVIELLFIILVLVILILYFVFIIKSFLNEKQFYKEIDKNTGITGVLFYFLLGMPFYIFMYFYFRNQMKKIMKEKEMAIEYEKKRRDVYLKNQENKKNI